MQSSETIASFKKQLEPFSRLDIKYQCDGQTELPQHRPYDASRGKLHQMLYVSLRRPCCNLTCDCAWSWRSVNEPNTTAYVRRSDTDSQYAHEILPWKALASWNWPRSNAPRCHLHNAINSSYDTFIKQHVMRRYHDLSLIHIWRCRRRG